jgi:hypothetical protein
MPDPSQHLITTQWLASLHKVIGKEKGIYPPLADADKIQFVPMNDFSKNEYAEKRKEFQKLFIP